MHALFRGYFLNICSLFALFLFCAKWDAESLQYNIYFYKLIYIYTDFFEEELSDNWHKKNPEDPLSKDGHRQVSTIGI